MAKTDQNMAEAFAGESQANRKYLAFAQAADKEGLPQVAKLFRAAAEAETIHAHGHLRAMGGVGDTAANLKAAVDGETHEFTAMYPQFIADAESESRDDALRMFRLANAVEEVHAGLYATYRETVAAGGQPEAKAIWVCAVCGNTVEDEPPDKCPICGAGKAAFKEIT
jgi:rubrerythrin